MAALVAVLECPVIAITTSHRGREIDQRRKKMFESEGVKLQSFNFRDVIGKNIVCEDGVIRRVEQISYSHRYADKVLINEVNEDETPGGAWVHVLSLNCQMYGNPIPTEEQKLAFTNMCKAFRWQQDDQSGQNDGKGNRVLPSGIVLPMH